MIEPRALRRSSLEAAGLIGARPPVRIVHLGLGAFHRAHQAWYTAQVDAAGEWGIAAFTGRDGAQAAILGAQDGLYTVVERGPERDSVELVTSIVEARAGSDLARLVELLSDPSVAIVTLTVTESGYRLTPDRRLDLQDPVIAADVERLRLDLGAGPQSPSAGVQSALGRLLLGLIARHRRGGAPLAVVPCDNIPDNGSVVREAIEALVAELADVVDADFHGWLSDRVSFVGTSVDRITPRPGADAAEAARAAGWDDHAAVVTEPFHGWVLEGRFPAGRPAWELAGARFVEDIEPWEQRKLWLLNGAHTILAMAGLRRGHATVAQAIADPACQDLVEAFWSEAVEELADGIEHAEYRSELLARFRNARIEHRLQQIATDTTLKLSVRIIPVAEARVAAGRPADGCAWAVAEWAAWSGAPDAAVALTSGLSARLAADEGFVSAVRRASATLAAGRQA